MHIWAYYAHKLPISHLHIHFSFASVFFGILMVGAGLTHGGGVLTAGAVGLTPADGMRQSAPGPNGYPGLRWARNGLGSERATARRPGPGREAGPIRVARRGEAIRRPRPAYQSNVV